jgi:hypothetical protein
MTRGRQTGWVWASSIALAAVLFVACGDGSSKTHEPVATTAPAASSTTAPDAGEDAVLQATDFRNVNTMTRVGRHFIANVNGHLDEALAVDRSKKGGVYPVGTVIQLVPQEAMVKRRAGFSPATNDWEFFSLNVSATGTTILARGGAEVLNRFGSSCAGCHGKAKPEFDFVCVGTETGCDPLPIGPDIFAALQAGDPRPKKQARSPQSASTTARAQP